MNMVFGFACGEGDEEDGAGAAVAVRGEGPAAEAVSPDAEAEEVERDAWLGPGGVAGAGGQVLAPPPGKCCFVRCGAQRTYQKIPWTVEGSCDAEGWKFCEQFYVAKLADAAWLRC